MSTIASNQLGADRVDEKAATSAAGARAASDARAAAETLKSDLKHAARTVEVDAKHAARTVGRRSPPRRVDGQGRSEARGIESSSRGQGRRGDGQGRGKDARDAVKDAVKDVPALDRLAASRNQLRSAMMEIAHPPPRANRSSREGSAISPTGCSTAPARLPGAALLIETVRELVVRASAANGRHRRRGCVAPDRSPDRRAQPARPRPHRRRRRRAASALEAVALGAAAGALHRPRPEARHACAAPDADRVLDADGSAA